MKLLLLAALLVALAIFSYFYIDYPLADYFLKNISDKTKSVLNILSHFANSSLHLVFWPCVYLCSLFVTNLKSVRTLSLQCFFATGFIMFFAGLLKMAVGRTRPDIYLTLSTPLFQCWTTNGSHLSLPSSHAAVAFGIFFLILRNLSLNSWFFIYSIGASFFSILRVIALRHYISDTILGGLLGTYIAFATLYIYNRVYPSLQPYFPRFL